MAKFRIRYEFDAEESHPATIWGELEARDMEALVRHVGSAPGHSFPDTPGGTLYYPAARLIRFTAKEVK